LHLHLPYRCPSSAPLQPGKLGHRGRSPAGNYSDALLQGQDYGLMGCKQQQQPPPDLTVLQALAVREQQQVCLQRVRYELERVRQLIDMVLKKEEVKWQVRMCCCCFCSDLALPSAG
jgi:hypothetical protein